jgi:plasmid stabilization system protein ParE
VTPQLVISTQAAADIEQAVTWLGDISPNLPVRFEEELERVYASVLDHPQMYPVVHKKVRRALLRRFPYSIFYILDASVVLILAVIHQSRDEETWKRRG